MKLTATIEMNLDNAAFTDNPSEVLDILERAHHIHRMRQAVNHIVEQGMTTNHILPLADTNGNKVGQFTIRTRKG